MSHYIYFLKTLYRHNLKAKMQVAGCSKPYPIIWKVYFIIIIGVFFPLFCGAITNASSLSFAPDSWMLEFVKHLAFTAFRYWNHRSLYHGCQNQSSWCLISHVWQEFGTIDGRNIHSRLWLNPFQKLKLETDSWFHHWCASLRRGTPKVMWVRTEVVSLPATLSVVF